MSELRERWSHSDGLVIVPWMSRLSALNSAPISLIFASIVSKISGRYIGLKPGRPVVGWVVSSGVGTRGIIACMMITHFPRISSVWRRVSKVYGQKRYIQNRHCPNCRNMYSFVTETIMASAVELQNFIDRQGVLLAKQREAEIERSSLLLSNCGPKTLEQKGLSLGGLEVVGMHVGLGGKMCAFFPLECTWKGC